MVEESGYEPAHDFSKGLWKTASSMLECITNDNRISFKNFQDQYTRKIQVFEKALEEDSEAISPAKVIDAMITGLKQFDQDRIKRFFDISPEPISGRALDAEACKGLSQGVLALYEVVNSHVPSGKVECQRHEFNLRVEEALSNIKALSMEASGQAPSNVLGR